MRGRRSAACRSKVWGSALHYSGQMPSVKDASWNCRYTIHKQSCLVGYRGHSGTVNGGQKMGGSEQGEMGTPVNGPASRNQGWQ